MIRKKFIAVCTPTLGSVSISWASVLRGLAFPLNSGYVNFFVIDENGGEIAETRNRCVQLALDYETPTSEVSHIFWIDDDVIISTRALLKLLSLNRDIASGVYFTKCDPSEPLIFPGRGAGTTPFVPDQLIETWGHGMGLCLVRTEVYKRMAKELDLGRDKYGRTQWYKTTGAEHATVDPDDNSIWMGGTEDLAMLNEASKLGYKPVVDTSRQAFGWHFCRESRQGYPKRQWGQFMRGETITWDTPDGPKAWE
jgi:hypothetical protein